MRINLDLRYFNPPLKLDSYHISYWSCCCFVTKQSINWLCWFCLDLACFWPLPLL